MKERALIIGAGQAGLQCAASLRQSAYDGDIVMIGAEDHLPYQRPPLSKAFLKGELATERLYLRPQAFYEKQRIELRLGEPIRSIDRRTQRVATDRDNQLAYDKLLIATGAPPRRLLAPGSDLRGIYYLRTLNDSNELRAILTTPGRVVIIGAGYIGLEVAAVARASGRDVMVVELAERVLARVASPPISAFYQKLHEDAGVKLRLGAKFERFLGDNGAVAGVELSDGEVIDATAIVVGIGAEPASALAVEAGLDVAGGIVVDDHARTSDESIWAAGDCTIFPSARYERSMRLESVPNAMEQAKVAAVNMAGGDEAYDPLPWFWSDQYDAKLQTVGLSAGYDAYVVRKNPASHSLAVWYFKDKILLAVDAVNDAVSFTVGKKLILQNAAPDQSLIADPNTDLKALCG